MKKADDQLYELLTEKQLEKDELIVIYEEYSDNSLLSIICTSICTYIDKAVLDQTLLNNNFLENAYDIFRKVLETNDKPINDGVLKGLKKINKRVANLDANTKSIIMPYTDNIEKMVLLKMNNYTDDNYQFLRQIIYEIKSLSYLKRILDTYPHYINSRNIEGKHIVLEVIDYLLKLLDKDIDDKEIIYYDSVVLEFIKRSRFHFSHEETKDCCQKLSDLIDNLNENDKDYKKKLTFYRSLLNELSNAEITIENIAMINEKYSVTQTFSKDIQKELSGLGQQEFIVTIDPEGCLDKDDAVSIIKYSDHYHLKVYIADIPRTIKRGSAIDLEGMRRFETFYLSDMIIPMYPTELSNDLLSLNCYGYKGVICHECDLYFDGSVDNFKFYPTTKLISQNLTYDEANEILKVGGTSKLNESLIDLYECAKILRKKSPDKSIHREVEDILNLEQHIFNNKNKYSERTDSEIISEEMMILIQCLVSDLYAAKGYPFIYRVHPEPESTTEYNRLMRLQRMIKTDYEDKDTYVKLVDGLLRAYPRAYYSLNNIGHFGLSRPNYCHCGSPLRRYPDTTVQQLNYDFIFSEPTKEKERYWTKRILELCEYCNKRSQENLQYQGEYERVKAFLKRK